MELASRVLPHAPQILSAAAVALIAAAVSTAPAASHWVDYCDAAGLVHVLVVVAAASSVIALGWVAVTQVILKSDGSLTSAELSDARVRVVGLAGWRVMLLLVILLPKTLAEAAFVDIFFAAVIAVSVLTRVVKGRWAAFEEFARTSETCEPLRGRFALALAACSAAAVALGCCVVCVMANPRTPLVLLVVDPATLLLNAGLALTHVAIEARDAGSLGGWDLRVDAMALVDCVFRSAIDLCSAVHYAAVWRMRGFGVTSIIEMVVLTYLVSCGAALVRHVHAYAAFRGLSQAVEAGFADATPAMLGACADCPVCFEAMSAAGGRVKVLPQCGHAFHWRCLRRWLFGGHDTCPVCRANLARAAPAQQAPAATVAAPAQQQQQQQQQRGIFAAVTRFLRMWEHYTPLSARRRPEEIAAALGTLAEMFPQLSQAALRRHLVEEAHGDLWQTANAAAAGLIEERAVGGGGDAANPAGEGQPRAGPVPGAAVEAAGAAA